MCCRFLIRPCAWACSRQHMELLGSEGLHNSPREAQYIATPPLRLSSRGEWFAWLLAKAEAVLGTLFQAPVRREKRTPPLKQLVRSPAHVPLPLYAVAPPMPHDQSKLLQRSLSCSSFTQTVLESTHNRSSSFDFTLNRIRK